MKYKIVNSNSLFAIWKRHELIKIQAIVHLKHSTTISHIDVFILLEISLDYIFKFSLIITEKKEKIFKSLLIHFGISFGLSLLWALLMKFIDWMLKTFLGTLIMVVIGIVMVIVAFMVYLGNVGYGNRHR